MATRPVFVVSDKSPHYSVFNAEFTWAGGFATSQKQKNVASMHRCFESAFPGKKALEISSKSTEEWGIGASAFYLKKTVPSIGKSFPVENVYQSGKVFERGGPYVDLLDAAPIDAKRDERLKTSGALVSFRLESADFPLVPKNAFYDFIYINALLENPDISERLKEYDGFTDIAFNPEKSLNCQARAAAIFVSLCRLGLIDKVKDFDSFVSLFGNVGRPRTVTAEPKEQSLTKKEEPIMPEIVEGDIVVHKVFGKGTVVSAIETTLKVQFPSVGEKTLGLPWVCQNCKIEKIN